MRLISFSMTLDSFCDRSKDVTRRLGWVAKRAPEGTHLMAVDKCQGLKPGQHPKRLGEILIVSNKPEPLGDIITNPCRYGPQANPCLVRDEVVREGFPNITPEKFVKLFCKMNPRTRDGKKVTPETTVNRIVFRRIA